MEKNLVKSILKVVVFLIACLIVVIGTTVINVYLFNGAMNKYVLFFANFLLGVLLGIIYRKM